MRGTESKQSSMLFLGSPESVVPKDHPIRHVKRLADAALAQLSPLFDEMYSATGRPSIPPERLLKASLLMALYTVRSERMFCEQLGYNLLFRWLLDMTMAEAPFEHSAFSHNRERLLKHDVAGEFFRAVVEQARAGQLLSHEHFTVDGTLIDAWASLKSFKNKSDDRRDPPDDPGNPTVSFHGEKRSNDTHASTTDAEAKLMRKGSGKEARLSYAAHALMENRHGLLVDFRVTQATGFAERETALAMLDARKERSGPITLGADKGYDTHDFVEECRAMNVVPHVAQAITAYRGSAIDGRTTRHPGYAVSQRVRKRVEEIFGWAKTVGNFRKTRFIGVARTQLAAYLVGAAYNLLRISKLLPNPGRTHSALT
jgi:transposase